MYTLSICTVFKNEAHILDEWIRHYLARGVDHFYLINDHSTDDYKNILDTFGDRITLFQNDVETSNLGRQSLIYEKYLRPVLNTSVWMAILDMDEFLYSPVTMDIRDILNKHVRYAQVVVDWLHFGSSGNIQQPKSVVDGFPMRARMDTTKPYYSYKSIFRTAALKGFGIHRQTVHGDTLHIHSEEGSPVDLVINHYTIQSLDFFMRIKATRGDCDNNFQTFKLVRDRAYFDSYDVNDIKDLRLSQQNFTNDHRAN
jgi:hypothetical protein